MDTVTIIIICVLWVAAIAFAIYITRDKDALPINEYMNAPTLSDELLVRMGVEDDTRSPEPKVSQMNASELISAANDRLADIDASLGKATERLGVLTETLRQQGQLPLLNLLMQGRDYLDKAHAVQLKAASEALGAAGQAVAGTPVKPPPPQQPPTLREYALNRGFPVAALTQLIDFAALHTEIKNHDAMIAAFYASLLTPVPQGPAASTQIDPRTLTEDDWQYFVRHPEVWKLVQASTYTNQQINEHQQGSGTKYNPGWSDVGYRGVLKKEA
jgi:hypothetical protein